MGVLYVSFGSEVRPRTFVSIAMGSAFLCILGPYIYSAGSCVIRVQGGLSVYSMKLYCFVQAKTLCRYGCIYV